MTTFARLSSRSVAIGLAVPLAVSSCGADVEQSKSSTKAAEVTNCGVSQSYSSPTAPIAYDVSAIEKMFALDLADKMRGIVLPASIKSVAKTSTFKNDYAAVELVGDDVLSQEQVVSSNADWVFAGWQAGFSPERGITPASLNKLGIKSYLQEETCYSYGRSKDKSTDQSALELTYRDLRNLGDVFQVQDKAKRVVASLQKREKALRHDPPRSNPPTVFVYDSGTSEPYTAGQRTAPHDIITLAGGRNAAGSLKARWDVVGWESVVQAEPDVIMVVDYDKEPLERKISYLKKQSPLRNSKAVKNNRIHVIDYGEAVSGPRSLDGAEKLDRYLDKEGF